MLLRPNRALSKLTAGDVAYGTITLIPEPSLAELLGAAGYDFIAIDMEHAAADGRAVENMIRAAEASKLLLWYVSGTSRRRPFFGCSIVARRASSYR